MDTVSFIVFFKWWDATRQRHSTTIKLILRRNRNNESYKVRNDVYGDKVSAFCGESLSSWFLRSGLWSRSSTAVIQPGFLSSRKENGLFQGSWDPRFHLVEQKTWRDSGSLARVSWSLLCFKKKRFWQIFGTIHPWKG